MVGEVGVETPPWTAAVLWVDVPRALSPAPGAEVLAARRRRGAVAPMPGEGMPELSVDQLGQRRRIGFVAGMSGLQAGELGVAGADD